MKIVGFGGTCRAGSSSERLVAAVLDELERKHRASVRLFGGAMLAGLPHYDPSNTSRTVVQEEFVEAVRGTDGVVIGSPGYHGGVSGLVKNAIDLLEDTSRDSRPYLHDLPVGLVVAAAGWQAGGVTLSALRSIVHAMRGWPTPLGIAINSVTQKPFDTAGALVDEGIAAQVAAQAEQIAKFAKMNAGV